MQRLLSVEDLAQLTGWRPFTIYKKSSDGQIPSRVKLGKNSLRFRAAEVEEWLQTQADSQGNKALGLERARH